MDLSGGGLKAVNLKENTKMDIEKIRETILGTRTDPNRIGRAFRVEFVKSDGTHRTMRARLGVKRNLSGVGMAYDPADYDLMTVWELGNNYRNIPLGRVTSLKVPDGHKHLKEVFRVGHSG